MYRPDSPAPPLDRKLFATDLVTIGAFRAPVDHPRFPDSGPIEVPVFVFPRTSVEIRHEGRAPFTADTCTVTYYNSGQRYTRRPVDARGDFCDWFAVRPDVLREMLANHDPAAGERPDRLFAFTHGPSDPDSYALQRMVVRHVQDSPAPDPLVVEEAVLQVFERVVELSTGRAGGTRSAPRPSPFADEQPLVSSSRRFLLENFRASISLDDVARAVDRSVFHVSRVFKRELGITVHRYRHQLRLRRSLELVAEGGTDLSEVAFHLGFSSHSHFSAVFREAFSMTPSEFRRKASSRRVRKFLAGTAASG